MKKQRIHRGCAALPIYDRTTMWLRLFASNLIRRNRLLPQMIDSPQVSYKS